MTPRVGTDNNKYYILWANASPWRGRVHACSITEFKIMTLESLVFLYRKNEARKTRLEIIVKTTTKQDVKGKNVYTSWAMHSKALPSTEGVQQYWIWLRVKCSCTVWPHSSVKQSNWVNKIWGVMVTWLDDLSLLKQ